MDDYIMKTTGMSKKKFYGYKDSYSNKKDFYEFIEENYDIEINNI